MDTLDFYKNTYGIKVPLKIRIFLWFLHNKVLLTKDNLAKRRWNGCTKCVFCGLQESGEHLFFAYSFAKCIWRLLHFTFGLTPPTCVTNFFGTWLNGLERCLKVALGLACVLFFGLFGNVEMILFLTIQEVLLFCRWFMTRLGVGKSLDRIPRVD